MSETPISTENDASKITCLSTKNHGVKNNIVEPLIVFDGHSHTTKPTMTAAYEAYTSRTEHQTSSQQHPAPHHLPASQPYHQPHYPHTQPPHQQPSWYDVSDGAATPPDETASHRDSRLTGGAVSMARRASCRVTVMAALEVLVLAAMASVEYLFRMTDLFPVHQLAFSCYDSSISSKPDLTNYALAVFAESSSGAREAIILICFFLPPLFMAVSELVLWTTSHHSDMHGDHGELSFSKQCRLSLSFRRTARFTGTYVFGMLASMILTDTIKLMVGRLRPDFLDVCQPNRTICETFPPNTLHYATDICMQTNPEAIRQARISFPSIQASMTVYAAFFIAIYVHNVICNGRANSVLRPFISLLFIFVSVFGCTAGYVVQRSHPSDIVAGSVIGLTMSVYLTVMVLNCFNERLSPNRLYTRLDRALGLMHCSHDDLDSSCHGDLKSRSSSSSGGTEWRCADSTSARSWSHYAVHHLTPLHPPATVSTSIATAGVLGNKVLD